MVQATGHWEIEVTSEREETERLFCDVLVALETWLRERTSFQVSVRVGGRSYTLVRTSDGLCVRGNGEERIVTRSAGGTD
jgi:hypothetical protein